MNKMISCDKKKHLDLDERVSRIYKRHIPHLAICSSLKENKETIKSLIGLCNGIHDIKDGVISALDTNNIYSANILFRSFIEHYTKILFIAYRFSKENANEVGIDNLVYSRAKEIIDYGNALKLYTKLIGGNEDEVVYKDAISKFSKKAAEKSNRELKEISEQFDYRNVIKFFEEHESDLFKDQITVFAPMVISFSELSSYVHAGGYANEVGVDSSNKYRNQMLHNVVFATAAVTSITCLCLSRDFRYTAKCSNIINMAVNKYSQT